MHRLPDVANTWYKTPYLHVLANCVVRIQLIGHLAVVLSRHALADRRFLQHGVQERMMLA